MAALSPSNVTSSSKKPSYYVKKIISFVARSISFLKSRMFIPETVSVPLNSSSQHMSMVSSSSKFVNSDSISMEAIESLGLLFRTSAANAKESLTTYSLVSSGLSPH